MSSNTRRNQQRRRNPRNVGRNQRGSQIVRDPREQNNMQLSRPLDAFGRATRQYQQYIGETDITTTAATAFYFGGANLVNFTPSLSTLDQVNQLTAVWDQYRIDRIDWEFRPAYAPQNYTLGVLAPLIYTVLDYDDGALLTSAAAAREYQTIQVHRYERFNVTCVPMCADLTDASGRSLKRLQWIDCATPNVPHFGLKGVIPAASGVQSWSVSTRITFTMKSVR